MKASFETFDVNEQFYVQQQIHQIVSSKVLFYYTWNKLFSTVKKVLRITPYSLFGIKQNIVLKCHLLYSKILYRSTL